MTDTTTTDAALPVLSQTTIDKLKDLRETSTTEFHRLVLSLRLNRWPLRAIADALNVSRSSVAVWQSKAQKAGLEVTDTEALPANADLPHHVKSVYTGYVLPEDAKGILAGLTSEASKVRRFTDDKAPSRKAARELERLLHQYREQGASLSALAEACQVSRRAVAQRLEKVKK